MPLPGPPMRLPAIPTALPASPTELPGIPTPLPAIPTGFPDFSMSLPADGKRHRKGGKTQRNAVYSALRTLGRLYSGTVLHGSPYMMLLVTGSSFCMMAT
jgi:hypothetical protein